MAVPLFTHPDCLRHDPGPDHPETPSRLAAILERAGQDPRVWIPSPEKVVWNWPVLEERLVEDLE